MSPRVLPLSLALSQSAKGREGVFSLFFFLNLFFFIYLRKYQASSTTTSSSRDTTSTAGRMWWLAETMPSEEGGEAEHGGSRATAGKIAGRGAKGGNIRVCVQMLSCVHVFFFFGYVCTAHDLIK